jgi:hypothetical protein
VGHLALDGVDWYRFLTSGDVNVGTLTLDTALVRLPYRGPHPAKPVAKQAATPAEFVNPPTHTLEMVLRALSRSIQLDTLNATNLTFIAEGRTPRDNSSTSVTSVSIHQVAFDDTDESWDSPFPVGRVTLGASHVVHTWDGQRVSLERLDLDASAGTISGAVIHFGASGSADDARRRTPYRSDQVSISTNLLSLRGVDFPEYLRYARTIVHHAALEHVNLDVLSDNRMPERPGRPSPHRTPQQFVRDIGVPIRADTIVLQGVVTYRERDASAARPGVLAFSQMSTTLLGFHTSTGPSPEDSPPLHIIADARLMGIGATHLDIILPLQAQAFQMRFKGSIGAMPADSLNGFLADAVGVRFTAGQIESIRFDATVDQGHARGTLTPRWKGLGVSLPGIARRSGGLVGGVRRAFAGLAANVFVVRADNVAPGAVRDGIIDQRWEPVMTLPNFIWLSLRGALLPLLQK